MSSTLVADLQTRLSQAEEELQLAARRFLMDLLFGFPIAAYGYDIGFIPRSHSRDRSV